MLPLPNTRMRSSYTSLRFSPTSSLRRIPQFKNIINSDQPVGRKLDFLIQEFNREANTIASKANDYTLAQIVVEIKAEIEKIREQIQNIE